jgi:hypothetical protein
MYNTTIRGFCDAITIQMSQIKHMSTTKEEICDWLRNDERCDHSHYSGIAAMAKEGEGQVTLFDGSTASYVSVHDEPVHKHLFSKEGYVYAYCATFEPGHTCLYHRHSEDTVYIGITGGQALNRPTTGPEFIHTIKQGDIWWAMGKSNPYVHQVMLLEDNPGIAKFMGIECLHPSPLPSPPPLSSSLAFCQLVADASNEKARVYTIDVPAGTPESAPHELGFWGMVVRIGTDTQDGVSGGGILGPEESFWQQGEMSLILVETG